jgi:predicted permease
MVSDWLTNAAILIYRRLLQFYPSEFRLSYGAGMERMFREQLGEARKRSPVSSVALLFAREVWGVLRTAPAQRFANLRAWKPACERRWAGGGIVLNVLLGDVRCAVRSFTRRPGFAFTVIAQLGLGIGATTTILSAVDNVLLRKLPYPRADELVVFSNPGHSYPLYSDWRDRTNAFSTVAAVWSDGRGVGISGDGAPESLPGARVTSEFFGIFGATVRHGRLLIDSDYDGEPPGVAVISYALWQRRWGGVWGEDRTLKVDGMPTEVVGVLDPAFQVPEELVEIGVEVWLPLELPSEIAKARTWNALRVVARRKPGLSTDAAQADVDALAAILADEYPATDRLANDSPRLYRLTSLFEAMVGDVANLLYTLLGAVGMMLLIGCANVANLFLARETGRTREMALRAALGAGRGRIMAQMLSESVLLALVGGVSGVLLAFVGVHVFEMLQPAGFPRMQHIAINPRVLCFAFLASLAAAVLFVIPPAIAASGSSVGAALKTTESGVTEARKPMTIRKVLVVSELATGLILLVGACLLFHSFVTLRSVDGGFAPENVLAMPLDLGARFSEEDRLQFTRELLDRLKGIPGVEAVGAGSTLPPYREGRCCWFQNVHHAATDEDPTFTMLHPITPGYFDVLGATILRGRDLTDADNEPGSTQTVINETLARRLFGEADPLGEDIAVTGDLWTVVGVVNDIRHWGFRRESGANAYASHGLFGGPFSSLQVAVRSRLDLATLSAAMREAVWAVNADLPIREISQLDQYVASSVAEPRFLSILMATFAALAVLLAAGGIYGFMAFAVRQRQVEFGIRIALGASRNDLARTVLRSVLLLTVIGSALGLAGALALSRLLGGVLYGVSPTDPVAFLAATVTLVAATLVASYLPTHSASSIDPMETLRIQ